MAEIRLHGDEVRLCIKDAQLLLHGVRHDAVGRVIDHIDVVLPWNARRMLQQLMNADGIDYGSLDAEA